MKKTCALLIVLCVLIGCVGCAVIESDTNQKAFPKDSHDVPFILHFDSFECISELKSMLGEDESTVDENLRNNQYHMNGLRSPNDICELFEDIGNLTILHLGPDSGYFLAGITYYVSYNYIMSTYKNDNDIVRFICYINNDDLADGGSKTAKRKNNVIGNIRIGNETLELYRVDDKNRYAHTHSPNAAAVVGARIARPPFPADIWSSCPPSFLSSIFPNDLKEQFP